MDNAKQIADAIVVRDGVEAVKEFFSRLGEYCPAGDYDSAERLFAPDVVSFGTKAVVAEGLATLRETQWQHIWPDIKGFAMLLDEVRASCDGDLAWGMVPWTSTGFDEAGAAYERPGRATIVLQRRDTTWLCIHTHFSLAPGIPPRSFGRLVSSP